MSAYLGVNMCPCGGANAVNRSKRKKNNGKQKNHPNTTARSATRSNWPTATAVFSRGLVTVLYFIYIFSKKKKNTPYGLTTMDL